MTYHILELRGRRVVAVRSRPTRQAAEALAGKALLWMEAENERLAGEWLVRTLAEVCDTEEPPTDTLPELEPPQFKRGFRVVACDRVDCPHCERGER
jgi:hypothetical protein